MVALCPDFGGRPLFKRWGTYCKFCNQISCLNDRALALDDVQVLVEENEVKLQVLNAKWKLKYECQFGLRPACIPELFRSNVRAKPCSRSCNGKKLSL